MAVYINDQGEELEVEQSVGRAQLEALGWTLLRGDVAAEPARPDIATLIVVDHDAGQIRVDGVPLPYLIGDNPLVHTVADDSVQSVWVQLLADRVDVVGEAPAAANAVPAQLDSAYTEPAVDPATSAESVDTAPAPWLGDLPGDAERAVAQSEAVESVADPDTVQAVSEPETGEQTPATAPVDAAADAEVAAAAEVEAAPPKRRSSRRSRSAD